jgi:hypothetical protein
MFKKSKVNARINFCLLLLFVMTTLTMCQGTNSEELRTNKPIVTTRSKYKSKSINSQKWIVDQYGCLRLRDEKLAQAIITENSLKHSTKRNFIRAFGKPNQKDSSASQDILIYFFDSSCENDTLDNAEKFEAIFLFRNDSLYSDMYICQ